MQSFGGQTNTSKADLIRHLHIFHNPKADNLLKEIISLWIERFLDVTADILVFQTNEKAVMLVF